MFSLPEDPWIYLGKLIHKDSALTVKLYYLFLVLIAA